MIEQLSLLPDPVMEAPQKRYFNLTVRGKRVRAIVQQNYCRPHISYDRHGKIKDIFATHHVEFRTNGPGPISESGYRSHFFHGTFEQLGITPDTVRQHVQDIAEWLADTYEKQAPERRALALFAKKHGLHAVNGGYR